MAERENRGQESKRRCVGRSGTLTFCCYCRFLLLILAVILFLDSSSSGAGLEFVVVPEVPSEGNVLIP